MTKDEIARRFPDAVAFARQLREQDNGVRLLFAWSSTGQLGRLQGYSEDEEMALLKRFGDTDRDAVTQSDTEDGS